MRSYKWRDLDHVCLCGSWGPKVPSHTAASWVADRWVLCFTLHMASHIWPSGLHTSFCLFSSLPVSIIYWHIHCQVRVRHWVNTPILRIFPPNSEHCRTPDKPCISGMENDCHLSPSLHLLTDGLWILTAVLYNEHRLLAYRIAERGGGAVIFYSYHSNQ